MQRQIKLQQQQIAIAQSTLERYDLAKQSEAVSAQELSNQQMAYNAQLENLSGLEREKANIEKQVQEQKITLNRLDGKHQAVLLQYNKTLSDNQSEIIQNLANDTVLIKAQVDGVVSVSYAEIGQFVDSSRTLASILLKDSQLIAQLYVPSRAIGFVKADDKVLLRYAAYPYQKFGHATGKIDTIAKTASASQSLPTIGTVLDIEQRTNEPVYVIKVKLDKQSITAYGEQLPLVAGMTLDGDIMHETRKLYEWVLEPLYSITGKVGSRSFINTP
ncbi:membrane fusion protein [Moraxella cuniculi DSM 21768]|uniref:Membrane fusion protein n=1 Tax=Moraxella cuniculi DSM 21768 TaxID=1122245 RepID=A0A1N7E7S0_9GAMM|nr:HlyD family efflux transporter periplasmic adaptor subunit [Moraxella cuniculi]SIR84110.1 membrane fusion protein [Moraxella cuniculi DSM 21768]